MKGLGGLKPTTTHLHCVTAEMQIDGYNANHTKKNPKARAQESALVWELISEFHMKGCGSFIPCARLLGSLLSLPRSSGRLREASSTLVPLDSTASLRAPAHDTHVLRVCSTQFTFPLPILHVPSQCYLQLGQQPRGDWDGWSFLFHCSRNLLPFASEWIICLHRASEGLWEGGRETMPLAALQIPARGLFLNTAFALCTTPPNGLS